jgi:ATP-binding cassette subfamily B protein
MAGGGKAAESDARAESHLLPAMRMAARFVWRAAHREFKMSLAAEAFGALSLAGVLLFGQRLVAEMTGDAAVDSLTAVLPETLGLGAALILSGVAGVVASQSRRLVAEQVTRHVTAEIVAVTSSVSYELYEEPDFHDGFSRSNAQASESSYQLVYDVMSICNMAATSVVVVVLLLSSVPEVLGALVLIGVPSVVAARASARVAFQTTYELTPHDRLRHYLYRALTGKTEAREVRVFGLAGVLQERWSLAWDDRVRRLRAVMRRQVLFNGLAAVVAALLVAGVLLILIQAAIEERISLGDAAVAIVALQQLSNRLRSAASASGSLRQSTLFLNDFERFRRLAPTADMPAEVSPQVLSREPLVVDHVSFRYPGTDNVVLDDVSLTIAPGEIVALVGVSGSGKTTLAHLVAGLYRPVSGRITFGGVDIESIPRPQYWASMAAVFQDFVRYELTARENVAMSDQTRLHEMAGIADAARRAGIDDAIERLSRGYETMMSRAYEDGADLSVGQWQRLAVARAFFREAPLLVLDEPAAALDAVAEQQLYERLVELCRARSVLLISHRFSTVRMADRIGVMEGGRLIELGSHLELMARGGRYAELFNLQASSYLTDQTPAKPPVGRPT